MNNVDQVIEFTIDELQALHSAQNIAHVIKIAFLFGSDEAFHSLCSLVLNGKDLSSTSKRIKREARINFYNGLVETQYPHISNFSDRNLTYLEFGAACQTFSDRWTNQYPLDELVSLAFIVDKDEIGEISLEVFLEFIEDVDHAFHSHPSLPTEALEDLYDRRREKLFQYVMHAFPSAELRTKLASLASVACQLNIQPLCSLIDLVETDIDPQPEDVIGYLIQLTGTVNQGMKDVRAAEQLAELEQSVAASEAADHVHFHGPNYNHNNLNHSLGHSQRRLSTGAISPIGSLASDADLSLAMSDHHDRLAGSHGLDQSPPKRNNSPNKTRSVAACIFEPVDEPQEEQTVDVPAQKGIAELTPYSESTDADAVFPELNAEELLQSIHTIQSKTQEIALALSISTTSPIVSQEVPESESQSAAATPSSISNEALLEQIQLMEAELHRAKQQLLTPTGTLSGIPVSVSVSAGAPLSAPSPNRGLSVPPLYTSHSPPRPPEHHHYPQQQQPGSAARRTSLSLASESGARRRFSVSSEISLAHTCTSQLSPHSTRSTSASRRPSLSGWTNTFKVPEQTPGKLNGTPGKTLCATPGSSSSSARSVGSHSMSGSRTPSAHPAPTSSQLVNMSIKRGKAVGSTGKLDRSSSSPMTKHVDLSIFKSPTSHKRPEARNVFDGEKQTWVPSSTKKLGAAAKPDRFATTFDLMVAREVNPVFFDN